MNNPVVTNNTWLSVVGGIFLSVNEAEVNFDTRQDKLANFTVGDKPTKSKKFARGTISTYRKPDIVGDISTIFLIGKDRRYDFQNSTMTVDKVIKPSDSRGGRIMWEISFKSPNFTTTKR